MRYPTVAHQWFEEVWNQKNEAAIDRLLRADAVGHGLVPDGAPLPQGPEGFKPFHRLVLQAFPDIRIRVDDCLPDGSRMAVRCTVTGTHQGEFLGRAATGKAVTFTGVAYFRVQDGLLAEGWNYFDFEDLAGQLDA